MGEIVIILFLRFKKDVENSLVVMNNDFVELNFIFKLFERIYAKLRTFSLILDRQILNKISLIYN